MTKKDDRKNSQKNKSKTMKRKRRIMANETEKKNLLKLTITEQRNNPDV